MSLINQVLKDVEARQGGAATDGWAGQQVKPVLSHQASSSGWVKRLILALVILGLGGWVVYNWPELQKIYFHSKTSASDGKPAVVAETSAARVKVLPAQLESAPVPSASVEVQAVDNHPQLTKALFSEWQAELSESVTKPAIRQKSIPVAPATGQIPTKVESVTQIEGEFSIRSAENGSSATVVSVIEPPLESGHAGKSKVNAETAAENGGVVNKHVRPEQEVNVLIQKAVDHEQKGRLSEGLATLRQALVTYPQSEDARQLLVAYLFENKQEAEAVTLLQAGIKRYPDQSGLSKSLAKWQLSRSQPEAVLSTLKPVMSAFAQDAETQWMMAIAYQQLSQHQAAVPHFERAIAFRPGQAQWIVAYAISLQAIGRNDQALQQLQSVQGLPLSDRLSDFVSQRIRQLGGLPQSRNE